MDIRPLLPDLFFRQLEEKDAEGISRSIEEALRQGEGVKHLLWAMRRYGGLLRSSPDCAHPTVVVDALADLVPTFREDSPVELLAAGSRYLTSLAQSEPRVELFEPRPGEPPAEVVPISSLEDALLDASLEGTCRTLGRLLRVIQNQEYLFEVLLETVAPDRSPDGHLLVHADSAVKALHGMDWESGRGILYRLVEGLSEGAIEPALGVAEKATPTPYRAAFMMSIEREAPERFWLYLSHAFQAERYAQMRPKAIRWALRAWIAERLFDGDELAMDCAAASAEPGAEMRSKEKLPEPPFETGRKIMRAVSEGASDATAEAMRWAQTLPDVDPLYRWIAAGAAPALADGDPRPMLAVNAARWGAHLVGSFGAGVLTERLMERLSEMSGRRP